MRLNRNPVLAAMAFLALAVTTGCGTHAALPGAFTASRVAVKADKDWKVLTGKVSKLLPTDNHGSRHQHFLVSVAPEMSALQARSRAGAPEVVKVAHNIDLAPVVPVRVGDTVTLKCEFIAAEPYDVAHWTHYDPRGGEGGYIELRGVKYDRLTRR